MMKRKWMGVNLKKEDAPSFKRFLFEEGISYEPSEMGNRGNLIHFEVFVNPEEMGICNDFIEGI